MTNTYIYKFTHMETGHFYIGSRCANILPPEEDFCAVYKSSSKTVKANFKDFKGEILIQFEDDPIGDKAWYTEQQMIKDNWNDPLILNKHYQHIRTIFSTKGLKRPKRIKLDTGPVYYKPRETRIYICAYCNTSFDRLEKIKDPIKELTFCSQSCSGSYQFTKSGNAMKGKKKPYMVTSKKWNKGIEYPQAAINGKASAAKQSATVTGRRIEIVDGKRKWVYPNKKGD